LNIEFNVAELVPKYQIWSLHKGLTTAKSLTNNIAANEVQIHLYCRRCQRNPRPKGIRSRSPFQFSFSRMNWFCFVQHSLLLILLISTSTCLFGGNFRANSQVWKVSFNWVKEVKNILKINFNNTPFKYFFSITRSSSVEQIFIRYRYLSYMPTMF
jgi:hypothetical protein